MLITPCEGRPVGPLSRTSLMSPHTLPAPVESVILMGQQLWLGMPDGGSRPPLTLFLLRLTWTTPYRSIRADSVMQQCGLCNPNKQLLHETRRRQEFPAKVASALLRFHRRRLDRRDRKLRGDSYRLPPLRRISPECLLHSPSTWRRVSTPYHFSYRGNFCC